MILYKDLYHYMFLVSAFSFSEPCLVFHLLSEFLNSFIHFQSLCILICWPSFSLHEVTACRERISPMLLVLAGKGRILGVPPPFLSSSVSELWIR